ncbi:MAG: hypothetical protein HY366_01755 [Candidatus Aenigmarchaeota archaeon]|nr:hypothetical protein [Candidatus Aenigmarchaeota archaeon]
MLIAVLAGVLFFLASARTVSAHCPLCTAATGALVATSRVAGLDDVITGTFLGAFTVSTAFWLARAVSSRLRAHKSRYARLSAHPYVLTTASLALTLAGLQLSGILSVFAPRIFGVDKLLLGTVLGAVVSVAAFELHSTIRRSNGGRNHIPFQGIVLPLLILIVIDALLYASGALV